MKQEIDTEVFAAMQGNRPVSCYKKTILAKVFVTVLNVFDNSPEGRLLTGQPGSADSMVYCYSIPEDVFFKRYNRRHLERGVIISVPVQVEQPAPEPAELPLEQASDETLRQLVNSRYKGLEAALNKTESEALVFRILAIAREEEKSEKIIRAIETRLAEIQNTGLTREEE